MGLLKDNTSVGAVPLFSLLRGGLLTLLFILPSLAAAQSELGSEDDLIVLGTDGTALDPDTEIKGFTVFGATQAAYTGITAAPGNVVVNGILAVSSGAYFVGGSTFGAAGAYFTGISSFSNIADIHIAGGAADQILKKVAGAGLQWANAADLVPGDDLGNHTATTTLQMGVYGVNTSSDITAAHYQINGLNMAAILPGIDSIAYGVYAGTSNIEGGDYNTFIGNRAGESNTIGNRNTATGARSLSFNTSGNYNTATGINSLYYNTTGSNNTATGQAALYRNETGSDNVAVGALAGRNNMTGSGNTAAGFHALYNNVTGSANTIMGNNAGEGAAGSSFSSSTIMGYQAGLSLTTGSDNLLLGWQTGDALTTGSRNIVIGYDEDAPTSTTNDYLNIGGLVVGDLSTSSVTVLGELHANEFYGDGSGLSGISGASPVGSALTSANIWVGNASNLAAAATLSGEGSLANDGAFTLSKSITPTWTGAHIFSAGVTANGTFALGDGGDTGAVNTSDWDISATGAMTGISGITNNAGYTQSGTNANTFTGNVGIGVSPAAKLHVHETTDLGSILGNSQIVSRFSGATISNVVMHNEWLYRDADGTDWTTARLHDAISVDVSFLTPGTNTRVWWERDPQNNIQAWGNNASTYLTINNGLVGIGTASPSYLFQVSSGAGTSGTIMAVSTGTSNLFWVAGDGAHALKFYGDGSNLTGVPGDDLGDHTATEQLTMGNYAIWSSSHITAAAYQINGSTVLSLSGIAVAEMESLSVGFMAGEKNRENGQINAFIGNHAGQNNVDGDEDTFVGSLAGYANTNGAQNTFVGTRAGEAITTGNENTLVGAYAAAGNRSGSANAIYGAWAGNGVYNQSFSSSTLMGYKAGYGLTTGSDNLLVGWQSGNSLTTGSRNIIIGYDEDAPTATTNDYINIGGLLHGDMAQSTMTVYGDLYADKFYGDGSALTGTGDDLGDHTATEQLKMGNYAIWSSSDITAASYQIGGLPVLAAPGTNLTVGTKAGMNGAGNVFIGESAGSAATTGNYSTVVGYQAGAAITEGGYNTIFGYQAGKALTSSTGNTFMGYKAGIVTATSNNVFIGASAGLVNTNGTLNTFVGSKSGFYNSTGNDNAMVGYQSAYYNAVGSANSILGSNAGYGVTGNSFSSSTLAGYYAGFALTTGSNNLLLGYRAGDALTTGSGNIIVGYDLDASGATASNEINIGGVYYGSTSAGTAQIKKTTVQAADSGITLTSADFGKTITVNSASAQTVSLPSVSSSDIGATIKVIKLGAGRVTIDAADSDTINNSGAGDTVYNNAVTPAYASIDLLLVTDTKWAIVDGQGAWITTD